MDLEPALADTIYLACNRAMVAENLAMVPAKEMKTYDELKDYNPRHTPERDLAWSDIFQHVAAWLMDREIIRRNKERNAPDRSPSNLPGGTYTADW